jgi:inner membrane protein
LALCSLSISTLYLGYAVINKGIVINKLNHELENRGIESKRSMITPAPLNSWLWYAIAETKTGYYTGYYSVFDRDSTPHLNFIPRNDTLLSGLPEESDLKMLKRFANGYYSITAHNDTLIFNDLRFGQAGGWESPDAPFVFYYFLQHPSKNLLVVQRGRFAKADKNSFRSLMDRIKGI